VVGRSINTAVCMSQIVGGIVQGMGLLTTEELTCDKKGKVASNSPANYKISTADALHIQWPVKLLERTNEMQTIYNSKAVGEPSFMLAASVWCAINNAIASLGDYKQNPELTMPATPEAVLKAVMRLQGQAWEIASKPDTETIESLTP